MRPPRPPGPSSGSIGASPAHVFVLPPSSGPPPGGGTAGGLLGRLVPGGAGRRRVVALAAASVCALTLATLLALAAAPPAPLRGGAGAARRAAGALGGRALWAAFDLRAALLAPARPPGPGFEDTCRALASAGAGGGGGGGGDGGGDGADGGLRAALSSLASAAPPPAWPLRSDGPRPNASALCAALAALPGRLRVVAVPLPRRLARPYWSPLPALAPYFNRGYPVEAYLLAHLARGPYSARGGGAADEASAAAHLAPGGVVTAHLLPLAPYALRVASFPSSDGLAFAQRSVAAAVDWVRASAAAAAAAGGGGAAATSPAAAAWARSGGCDFVLVSTHDKGGRVAALAPELQRRGVLVTATADTGSGGAAAAAAGAGGDPSGEDAWRYTAGKDVAAVPSFAPLLARWSLRLGACPAAPAPPPPPGAAAGRRRPPRPPAFARTVQLSFTGGNNGEVRRALFAPVAAAAAAAPAAAPGWLRQRRPQQQPWPGFALSLGRGHASPGAYARQLASSRFCLHVRGTQVQSPRLIESILFGCVPVVMADGYDLPLSAVLNWSAFSLRVPQATPLAGLRAAVEAADEGWDRPGSRYSRLAAAACAAAPFFTYHAGGPKPGDAFHMTALELADRLAAPRPGCGLPPAAAAAAGGAAAALGGAPPGAAGAAGDGGWDGARARNASAGEGGGGVGKAA